MRRTLLAAVLAAGLSAPALAAQETAPAPAQPTGEPEAQAQPAQGERARPVIPASFRRATAFLTREDVAESGGVNVHEVVRRKRARWLRPRGYGTNNAPDVVVYLDDTRMGNVSTLERMTVQNVVGILYFDGTAAQQRFGQDTHGGVIQVLTRVD